MALALWENYTIHKNLQIHVLTITIPNWRQSMDSQQPINPITKQQCSQIPSNQHNEHMHAQNKKQFSNSKLQESPMLFIWTKEFMPIHMSDTLNLSTVLLTATSLSRVTFEGNGIQYVGQFWSHIKEQSNWKAIQQQSAVNSTELYNYGVSRNQELFPLVLSHFTQYYHHPMTSETNYKVNNQ